VDVAIVRVWVLVGGAGGGWFFVVLTTFSFAGHTHATDLTSLVM
jgi:hypothetical protein